MRSKAIIWSMTLSVLVPTLLAPVVKADVTSPSIKDVGKKYTREKPITSYYGTGNSARLVEASELRMAIEDLIAAGEWEQAIPKAKKAVQLDPGDPAGHLFLAKVLTMKFYETKGKVDEKLLADCVREWQLIRYHDADPTEQWEAGQQVKKFQKIAKALEKNRMRMDKEGKGESIAKKDTSVDEDKDGSAVKVSEKVKPSTSKSDGETDKEDPSTREAIKQLAARKKIFGVF